MPIRLKKILIHVIPLIGFSLVGLEAQVKEAIPDLNEDSPVVEIIEKAIWQEELSIPLPEQITLSLNESFQIIGKDHKQRADVVRLAEALRSELFMELGRKPTEKTKTQIQIHLIDLPENRGKGSPYRKSYGKAPNGGFYIKLLVDTNRMKRSTLRVTLIELLLLEYSISNQDQIADDVELVSHTWVVDGLLNMLDWRAGRVDKQNFIALSNNPRVFDLEQVYDMKREEVDKLDDATRKSYQAACGALMMSLIQQPDGKKGADLMLKELSFFQGDVRSIIQRYFPNVNKGKNGIRVSWMLQLAFMGANKLTESMDILESDKRLSELLNFQWKNEDGELVEVGIEGFGLLKDLEEQSRETIVVSVRNKLLNLKLRCFPTYREIIGGYEAAFGVLTDTPGKGRKAVLKYKKQLAEKESIVRNITEKRKLAVSAAKRSRDYLDWYAIHGDFEVKGDFSGFTKLNASQLEKVDSVTDNHLARYLNILQKLYEN